MLCMVLTEQLYFPEKVLIPERYDAEADAEQLTEAQKMERQEKADRIKRLLTNQRYACRLAGNGS